MRYTLPMCMIDALADKISEADALDVYFEVAAYLHTAHEMLMCNDIFDIVEEIARYAVDR